MSDPGPPSPDAPNSPGDSAPPASLLASPPAQPARLAAGRAVRILGLTELVFFTVAAALVGRAAGWSAQELQDWLGHERITYDLAVSLKSLLMPFCATIAGLGALPGAAYLLASFPIARGSAVAVTLATILAMMQVIVLGALLVWRAGVAFRHGDPSMLTPGVLVFGTPMAAIVYVVRLLVQARVPMTLRTR